MLFHYSPDLKSSDFELYSWQNPFGNSVFWCWKNLIQYRWYCNINKHTCFILGFWIRSNKRLIKITRIYTTKRFTYLSMYYVLVVTFPHVLRCTIFKVRITSIEYLSARTNLQTYLCNHRKIQILIWTNLHIFKRLSSGNCCIIICPSPNSSLTLHAKDSAIWE